MIKDKLNPKQAMFVKEYLIDLNATQAAIRAGYSLKTAGQIGEQLLKKLEIQGVIQKKMEERSKRTEVTADMVLAELARIGFSNITHYTNWNDSAVNLVPSEDLTEDAARCVSEITQSVTSAGASVKFKLHDKVGALEKIARHLGMFNDKLNIGGQAGNPLGIEGKIEIIHVKTKGDAEK